VCGESVGVAAIFGQVGVVLVLARVLCEHAISFVRSGRLASCKLMEHYLLCTHEQQMLYRMRYSRQIFHIAEAADVDVHSRRGLVGVGIVDKQDFKLVGQLDDSV
jgi:hypothetical protein